jgi:hypothetical protein
VNINLILVLNSSQGSLKTSTVTALYRADVLMRPICVVQRRKAEHGALRITQAADERFKLACAILQRAWLWPLVPAKKSACMHVCANNARKMWQLALILPSLAAKM